MRCESISKKENAKNYHPIRSTQFPPLITFKNQFFLRKPPCLGWLPYARRPSLPFFMLAPSWMSTRGGVEKPKDFATLTRSRLLTLKTLRRLWEA